MKEFAVGFTVKNALDESPRFEWVFVEGSVPIELLNELVGENIAEILRDRARFRFKVAYLNQGSCECTIASNQVIHLPVTWRIYRRRTAASRCCPALLCSSVGTRSCNPSPNAPLVAPLRDGKS